MSEELLCKDCKYCRRNFFGIVGLNYATCRHPQLIKVGEDDKAQSLVDGKSRKKYHYCSTARYRTAALCGPEGKLFEAKTRKGMIAHVNKFLDRRV